METLQQKKKKTKRMINDASTDILELLHSIVIH